MADDSNTIATDRGSQQVKSPPPQRSLRNVLLIGALGLVIMFSVPQSIQIWAAVSMKLQELRVSEKDNVIWNLTQLEVEYLKLERALVTANAADNAESANLSEVRRRYDIYYSRLNTLDDGAFYRRAFQLYGTAQELRDLRSEIEALEPVIDQSDAVLFRALPEILAQQQANGRVVRRIINKGNQYTGEIGQETRDELSRLLLRLSTALIVSFVALALTVLLLFRNSRWYRARAIEHKNASARFAAVIATSPDALIVTDAAGAIVEFNHAAETLMGVARSKVLGDCLVDYLRRPGGGKPRLPLTAREGRSVVQLDVVGQTGGATPVDLSQGMAKVENQRFYVYFLRDISDRLAADQALLASRDRALAGEQAKSRFLAVMSHEMRTPLNGIMGLIEVMRSGDLSDSDRKRYLGLMRTSSQILLGHVNDVLDIAKLEAKGLRLNLHRFNLDEMLTDLMDAMAVTAQAHGNTLSLDAPDAPFGACYGDAHRLRQVLTNLVSNAIKFTENGEITLSVTCHNAQCEHPDRSVMALEFQISDTGIGIAEEDQDRIFGDFVRLEAAEQDHVEGTGLGLGIAKRIVQAMGGRIGVDSIEGEGSVFWVRLDLPVVDGMDDNAAADVDAAMRDARAAVSPLNILVVEDNATNRLVVRDLLERDGHCVSEEVNGKRGVERARGEHFDVIFMDINMPVMGGLEASRQIRETGACQHSRIVALTAHVMDRDDNVYQSAGMDAVLSKPLQWDDLRRVLKGETVHMVPAPLKSGMFDQQHLEKVLASLATDKADRLLAGVRAEGDALIDLMVQLAPGTQPVPLDQDMRRMLTTQAHALAGSASMVGATQLRRRLNRFESVLDGQGTVDLRDWRDELRVIWTEAKLVMEETENRLALT